jgi:hypothetical protein
MSCPTGIGRGLVFGLLLLVAPGAAGTDRFPVAPPLPTERSRWVGEPTSWDALRGRVTLVFVWTFD